ncbi:MAG: 3-hydroxyacyl-CoA dehydrogenase family protein [Alphaproteobacteria bacterium]|nr:3-hydroxyacyl-CoA dehydrogenase family protein [Alphaproteobacteria bacterium]
MTQYKHIGIIGAGTMGSGIAGYFASKDVASTLVESNSEQVDRAKYTIARYFNRQAERGKITAERAAAIIDTPKFVSDLAALQGCDLIIEAVFEDMAVKETVLRAISDIVSSSIPIATNTSCLRVTELAEFVANPARFAGLHFFSPAMVNPIVEVVRCDQTDPTLYQDLVAFCAEHKKIPITCGDAYGFAINRFFVPYCNEAIRITDEGLATPTQIDLVAQDVLAVAAGPFRVMNLVKPRIMYKAQQHLRPHGAFYALADSLAAKGDSDYEFTIESAPKPLDEKVAAVIGDRLRAAAFLPILQAIDEGVAEPAAFDLGAKKALQFNNPPCALMDSLGKETVATILESILPTYGIAQPKSIDRIGALIAS